jgi:integrase
METVSKREFVEILAPLAPQNQFQTLMVLRVLYREALNRELVSASPVANIRPPRIRVEPKKFLTWEEVRKIDFGKYDDQIKFLALHGLRWGEAVALRKEDIYDEIVHVNKSFYGITKTKSGVREVPYFGYYKPFPKSRQAIAQSLKQYGVCIHSLRNTYAYFLKTNNIHVTTAAKFMGHSNPMITLSIYTMVLDTEIVEIGVNLRNILALETE